MKKATKRSVRKWKQEKAQIWFLIEDGKERGIRINAVGQIAEFKLKRREDLDGEKKSGKGKMPTEFWIKKRGKDLGERKN